tara:strand:+ start:75 stop:611 length:537 start_codon:yes stop_codon:yes gene_type:complete
VDIQLLAALPGFLNYAVLTHMPYLLNNIQLTQPISLIKLIVTGTQHGLMAIPHILYMPQPVTDQAKSLIAQSSSDAATAIMTNHKNMLDLQHLYGELQNGQAVEIRVYHYVGYIPVHKKLAGRHINNLVGWHSAIGTANPQIFRRLLIRQALKKLRIIGFNAFSPGTVLFKKVVKLAH